MKRVLCAVDLSEASAGPLKYAAAIQRWYGGSVTLLHVVPTFDAVETHQGGWFDPVTVVYTMRREEVVERMQQVAAATIPSARVSCEAEAGDPVVTIVDRAIALSADIIVVGAHARHGFETLGSVADAVLRRAPCDVLTVPADGPGRTAAAARIDLSTIVCGVDFSPEALNAARAAFALAGRVDARLVLVHAIEWLAGERPPDYTEFNVAEFQARLICNAQQRLDAVADQVASDVRTVRTKVAVGRAYRELLRFASEERAGLVVIGQQGSGAAPLPLVGSTAEQVVRGSSCPVLIVHGDGRHAGA